jgi:hypothetical protein
VSLAVQSAGAAALFVDLGDPSWFASHLGSAFGSAILIALACIIIDLAASSAAEIGTAMRVCGWSGFAVGWCFSVLGGVLVSFHPVMLIYIVFFGGTGLTLGLVFGAAAGSIVRGARADEVVASGSRRR